MTDGALSEKERRIVVAIQDGLPLVPRPYESVARSLGTSQAEVIAALSLLMEHRVIKRLGAVPNHYALGIAANGMAVWDVPDGVVDELGRRLAIRPEVTHCYRRPRRPPEWRYNLYAMVHGRSRAEVKAIIDEIAQEVGLDSFPHDLLFSLRQFRKRGTRLGAKLPSD